MSFPSDTFFATVYQTSIPGRTEKLTNFPLPSQSFFIGIPYIIVFVIADTPSNASEALKLYDPDVYDEIDRIPFAIDILNTMTLNRGCTQKIGLWGTDDSKDNNFQKSDNTFPYSELPPPASNIKTIMKGVIMYTNHGYFQYGTQLFYFSTLDNGTTLYHGEQIKLGTIVLYTIPDVKEYPDTNHTYNTYRYFTYLNYGDVNLNTNKTVTLGWSSSDISGDYGADPATLSIYKENGTKLGDSFNIINNTVIPISTLRGIPSGRYYYVYDFVTIRIQLLQTAGIDIYYDSSGNSSLQQTPVFTFITQFPQFVTANNITVGGTSTITLNVGDGYPLYTYLLSINDSANFSQRMSLANPYVYTPPYTVNTRTYIITVSNSDDPYYTGSVTTTITSYQYVTNLAISTRILQSARNFVTWLRGSITEQFQYGTTAILTNGSTTFYQGNSVDTTGFTAGTAYAIQPTNINENNGSYTPFYFDSVAPNQRIFIARSQSLQTYTLSWNAYYKFSSPAPDGIRQYQITFTGNGITYTATSNYNVVKIPFSAVTYAVPYSIQVEDIIVATDVYFFDAPTNFDITPNYLNYENTISWVSSGNPDFNVLMGQYQFQSSSPYVYTFTEDIIDINGDVSFWPLNSPPSSAIRTDTYEFTTNTFSITFGEPIIFGTVVCLFDLGSYLYPTDTFSLSLYRNGQIIQLESSITTPYLWKPYTYVVTYQPNDQLYLKSNEHLNYGISIPFTFLVNASVTLDKTNYQLDSTIIATMTIGITATFSVQLQDVANLSPPIPVTFTLSGTTYFINLNDYNLNLNTYRVDFVFTNSPTIIVSSPSFELTIPITIEANSIYSLVKASLYVDLPTVFTVTLFENLNAITLPSFTANLLSTYSFQPSGYGLTNTTYYLQFSTAGLTITSPTFTLAQTATITLDQSSYTIVSTILSIINLGVYANAECNIQLQDADNVNAPITLPPFNVNSISYYSFSPYSYNLTNTGYYLIVQPVGLSVSFQSEVFQMSRDYYTLPPTPTPVPMFARATSNILCKTEKKYNIATTIITVIKNVAYPRAIRGNPQFIVPCPILTHLVELNQLLKTLSLRDALLLLVQKYDIRLATQATTSVKRYQYPTGNAKIEKPILQYSSSYRLANKIAGNIVPDSWIIVDKMDGNGKASIQHSTIFVDKVDDARVFTICNDDTKTFSTFFTDMITNSSYWLNKFCTTFKADGAYLFCIVRPINGSIKQIITASISLIDNKLIFTPLILRVLLSFYEPYPPGDITILFSSTKIQDIYNYLIAAYEKYFINPATAI